METPTPEPISDSQVFQNLMSSLQQCLQLDGIICEQADKDPKRADQAAAQFDRHVDLALEAHCDLVNRGLTDAIASFLAERAPVWEGAV